MSITFSCKSNQSLEFEFYTSSIVARFLLNLLGMTPDTSGEFVAKDVLPRLSLVNNEIRQPWSLNRERQFQSFGMNREQLLAALDQLKELITHCVDTNVELVYWV